MEGISHEACSLAGTLRLNKLIALYDDNGISIDGQVEGWFTDDTPKRFEAYGWNVIRAMSTATMSTRSTPPSRRRKQSDKPTLICCKTVIGKGAPTRRAATRCTAPRWASKEIAATRAAHRLDVRARSRFRRKSTRRGTRRQQGARRRSRSGTTLFDGVPRAVPGRRRPNSSAA